MLINALLLFCCAQHRSYVFDIHVKCFLVSQWVTVFPVKSPLTIQNRTSFPLWVEDCLLFSVLFVTLKNRELLFFPRNGLSRFSYNMFCSSGNKRRPRSGAAGLHGAAHYETGPTWSGHRGRPQQRPLAVQHAREPAAPGARESLALRCPSRGRVRPFWRVKPLGWQHLPHMWPWQHFIKITQIIICFICRVHRRSMWPKRKWLLLGRKEVHFGKWSS